MVKLSSSKINSYLSCSYRAWCNYHLNFPRTGSSATKLGSTVHELLELLVLDKHKKIHDTILETKSILLCKALVRLIKNKLKKLSLEDGDLLSRIESLLYIAIKNDLKRQGSNQVLIEMPFKLQGKNFIINGFCDQVAIYNDKTKVVDFKTGKKPTGASDENYLNVQGLIYEWAIKNLYPELPTEVEFHYLDYKKACVVRYGLSNKTLLDGLENWLEYIADYIGGFTYQDAISNLAYSNGGKYRLCGGSVGEKTKTGLDAFICEMKYPRVFFVAKIDDRVIDSSFFKNELLEKHPNCIIEERTHQGCPAWKFLWEK